MALAVCSVDALPRIGGVSIMAHELCNALTTLAERVVFIGPRGSHVPRQYNRRYFSYEDLDFAKSAGTGRNAAEEDRRIARLFGRIITRESIDRVLMIHPHHYGIGAQMAADDAGIPLSVYFHGFELRSQLKGQYPASVAEQVADHWPTSLRERSFSTIANAQELLANSRYTASLLEPFPQRPAISVTGCGIPDTMIPQIGTRPDARVSAREALGLPQDAPVLAFVGRIEPTKRADRLIEIAEQLSGAHVVIGGSGPGEPLLIAAAEASSVGDRVRLLGRIDETTKRTVLQAADFACLLSEPDDTSGRVEGFGIALLEGAACGAIPVSSGTGGMGDVVTHGQTGLILPPEMSAPDAAEMLRATLADPASMAGMRDNAQAQLRNRFNWTTIAATLQRRWRDRLAA